jgi:hypothetical protein
MTFCLRPVLFRDLDPAVGDLVQVDQVVAKAGTKGFINAAICGTRRVSIRARPEPPSSTPTARISFVTGTANMVFSFSE